LRAPPFQFFIGKDKECFYVPVTLAKKISVPLHAMMNNCEMKEGREGKASLEEVHSDTFVGFCEFVYTGDYRVPNGTADPAKPKGKSLSNIRAATMSIPQTTKHLFDFGSFPAEPEPVPEPPEPVTEPEPEPDPPEPEYTPPIVEEYAWGFMSTSKKKKKKSLTWHEIERYEYLWEEFCSLNYDRILPEANDAELDGDGMKEIEFNPLLFHCKLYVFAQMYLIASLKQLTLCKLHAELKTLDSRPETIDEVLETLEFAYTKTERGYDCKDELRHLLVAYAASKTGVLKKNVAFRSLLDAYGELGSDMVLALG
jgi:hypothetical protein